MAPASPTSASWNSGRVLGPSDTSSWDCKTFGGAVIVPADPLSTTNNSAWRMYYYGRGSDMWNMGVVPFNAALPTGRIGLALSNDGGLSFARFKGPLPQGALFDPSDDPTSFDCVHIAVGDVFFNASLNQWLLYYFGGGLDEMPLVGFPDRLCKGVLLQPGLAISDDGIHFHHREGPILTVGDAGCWDQNGVSWPRVLQPSNPHSDQWIMSYHTRESGGMNNFGFFSAGIAVSADGKVWEKKGKVLSCGEPGTWDEGGVSVRHIVRYNGKYLMFYEGSNYKFDFSIGLATSDDGLSWVKDLECGPEPGGPVLKARKGEDVWDNVVVGTPYVIVLPDGSLRMYYLGVGKKEGDMATQQGIGLATSIGTDFRTWRRVCE
ncbi:hypothetical protein KP509_33G041100 [Ceratopteris richardii]|nr:hypothetical protein KP509_33G041100 [Ceratopteris richardii]